MTTTPNMTPAARDVLAERERQINEKGWTSEYCDRHEKTGMKDDATGHYAHIFRVVLPWKFEPRKPYDHRQNLVKAGALILAEIERLDRIEQGA